MNATRFAQKPLPQPSYSFADVPRPAKNLKGSSLQYVTNRDDWQTCLAEMLLLCKEAARRKRQKDQKTCTSKPLSLEYLADRMDVDDPLWGYLIRSKQGMLQGFCSVTTFTTYQPTFRWDSLTEAAFAYDDQDMDLARLQGERRWDADGSLAFDLQNTVRCGDIYMEGVVWPRIAEISLLGGLGCGKTLLSLVLERLEGLRATNQANYDYVVLQATDNSVSFYESMGFVRIGAVVEEQDMRLTAAERDERATARPRQSATDLAIPSGMVMGKTSTYRVKKAGETPSEVAKKAGVDTWDLLFLNRGWYPDLTGSSRLLVDTVLRVPVRETKDRRKSTGAAANETHWYVAKENDTPRSISKKFDVNCQALVQANQARLAGLMANSRLRNGTRVKVSNFEVQETICKPYAHWGFPDDAFEEGEPSYMMAYRLQRRRGNAAKRASLLESLAIEEEPYKPTDLVMHIAPPSPRVAAQKRSIPRSRNEILVATSPVKATKRGKSSSAKPKALAVKNGVKLPPKPKRPLNPYMLFSHQQRTTLREELSDKKVSEASQHISSLWKNLSSAKKRRYEAASLQMQAAYKVEKEKYLKEIAQIQADFPVEDDEESEQEHEVEYEEPAVVEPVRASPQDLYNAVVRLKPGVVAEESDYTYWYVLTYIPDLRWCHLGPLTESGTFEGGKAVGRTKYMLVDEKLGKEVDISAGLCIPVKAKSMRKTLDADKEEWDIFDDGEAPTAGFDSVKRARKQSSKRSKKATTQGPTSQMKRGPKPQIKKQPKSALRKGVSYVLSARSPSSDEQSSGGDSDYSAEGKKRKMSKTADKPTRGRPQKKRKLAAAVSLSDSSSSTAGNAADGLKERRATRQSPRLKTASDVTDKQKEAAGSRRSQRLTPVQDSATNGRVLRSGQGSTVKSRRLDIASSPVQTKKKQASSQSSSDCENDPEQDVSSASTRASRSTPQNTAKYQNMRETRLQRQLILEVFNEVAVGSPRVSACKRPRRTLLQD